MAGTKAMAVVGPPRCREGVVERGELRGEFDEPLLPSYGVTVFAQRIRTIMLLIKIGRRPENGKKNRG